MFGGGIEVEHLLKIGQQTKCIHITRGKSIFSGNWHITYIAQISLIKCFQICCHDFCNNPGVIRRNVNTITLFCHLINVFVRWQYWSESCFQYSYIKVSLVSHVCCVAATSLWYLFNQWFKDYYWHLIGTIFYHPFPYW